MRLTLGMIVKDEAHFLGRILPIIRPCFDEFIAVDAYSTDRTVEILEAYDAAVFHREWNGNYSDARNSVIAHATGDFMVMLDADEAMYPDDIKAVREIAATKDFFSLRRIEFVNDMDHYDPKVAPDYQARFFTLSMRFHFEGNLHEALFCGKNCTPVCHWPEMQRLDIPIYHYGQTKPRAATWLRHENYRRILAGEPLLTEVPPGTDLSPRGDVEVFLDPHPLKYTGGNR